jgi:phosphate/sulfate permease
MQLEHGLLFIILGSMGAFFMAFNNGANDIANAFASAVGSKALKMKLAIAIASVVTFAGALLLGGQVAAKLVSGLVPPTTFNDPTQYVMAMIAVLVSSGIFVLISTLTALPVSSSQAIVGSLTGISILLAGWNSVNYAAILVIILGWVISPLIAGLLALLLCYLLDRKLIGDGTLPGTIHRVKRWLPVIVSIVLCAGVYALFTLTTLKSSLGIDTELKFVKSLTSEQKLHRETVEIDGMKYNHFRIGYHIWEMESLLNQGQEVSKTVFNKAADKIYEDSRNLGNRLSQLQLLVTGKAPSLLYLSRLEVAIFCLVLLVPVYLLFKRLINLWLRDQEDSPEGAQRAFKSLQIGTSCYVAFAIGSNDVANSISPVLAIYLVVQAGGIPESFSCNMPIWILIIGGAGMVTGISILGYRVMKTLGENLTKINNSRGFCIDFSVATTVVGASSLGLPVSTTHAATGAVVGSGLSQGLKNVQFKVLAKIASGWLITIPVSSLITVGVFKLMEIPF